MPVEVSTAQYTLFGLVVMTALGAGLAALLYFASRVFKTDTDPRVEKILEVLPNANCGACGLGGCVAYAEALVTKGLATNLCAPGRAAVAAKIAAIMGTSVETKEPEVAVVHCGGDNKVAVHAADYYGVPTCKAANVAGLNSPKGCLFGCLGLGDCAKACLFNAMVMGEDGLPLVIESACVACKKCVAACPRNIIEIHQKKSFAHVLCKSHDAGKDVLKVCKVGCIACKKCEKICPVDAIHVIDNLAVIDYAKCISCGKCVKECPQSIIVNWRQVRKEADKLYEPVTKEA
jgi:Na+-translocating ferredoxin:NAD+ oxidoreductase RNF subunit RnfB